MQYFNLNKGVKMLSKSLLKLIKSLELKKYRKEHGLFVAEGGKTVCDLIAGGMSAETVIATSEWLDRHKAPENTRITEVSEDEMKRASFLRTPQGILAIFRQPEHTLDYDVPTRRLCLALDNVQDPGNLGTIVRIADWFGIEEIYCSTESADIYNPKCIQATMGAAGRVKVFYTNLTELLEKTKEKAPVYGTFLDGKDVYNEELSTKGIIVMGNEGNGISAECARHITKRILIPNYPTGRETSESLNVSTATAIICSEFRRRMR